MVEVLFLGGSPMVEGGGRHTSGIPVLLTPGTRVEVRSRFDDSWARGFEVVTVDGGGYRLRRHSDGSLLPVPIPLADVRRERKRETWWV